MDACIETGLDDRIDAPRKAMDFDWKAGMAPREEGASPAHGGGIGAQRPGRCASWEAL
jgi:hypothetical protein